MATYNFFRRGGTDQLRIEKPEDLEAVETLDKKLWVALSMPVIGQELDVRTLKTLDINGDGRIRALEILAAVKFVRAELSNFDAFFAGKDTFPLSALAPAGTVAEIAPRVLSRIGKSDASELSLADVDSAVKNFDEQPFNGDGVLVPASTDDPALADFIASAVAATGGADDASGEKGITAELAAGFVSAAADVLRWREEAAADAEKFSPLGAETESAFAALKKIRAKVDDFFARVRLASFDAAAAGTLNPDAAAFAALAGTEISASASAAFPLARIAPADGAEPALPLSAGVNPAWAGALADFSEKRSFPPRKNSGSTRERSPRSRNRCGRKSLRFSPPTKIGSDAFPRRARSICRRKNFAKSSTEISRTPCAAF